MMIQSGPEVGFVRLAASAVIGTSGKAVAIYGYNIVSGGTAGVVTLFNGTSSVVGSGTVAWTETGTINVAKSFPIGHGVVLPSGCFFSFDSNVTGATVWFRQVVTTGDARS